MNRVNGLLSPPRHLQVTNTAALKGQTDTVYLDKWVGESSLIAQSYKARRWQDWISPRHRGAELVPRALCSQLTQGVADIGGLCHT